MISSSAEFRNIRHLSLFKQEKGVERIRLGNEIKNGEKVCYNGTDIVKQAFLDENGKVLAQLDYEIAKEIQEHIERPINYAIADYSFPDGKTINVCIALEITSENQRYEWATRVWKDKMRRFGYSDSDGSDLVGLAKRDGFVLIEPSFKSIGNFNWNKGLAPAQFRTGKWGFIDYIGHTKIQPLFDDVYGFNNYSDITPVLSDNGKWGYIYADGSFAIKLAYDAAFPFDKRGFATVEDADEQYLIDRNCNYIDPSTDNYSTLYDAFEGDEDLMSDTLDY